VKQSRIMRAARAVLALTMLFAWLHAANHCVVAALLPDPAAVTPDQLHEGCPGHPAPNEEQKDRGCDGSSCCKSVVAPLVSATAVCAYDTIGFVTRDYLSDSVFGLGEQHLIEVEAVDTGPPGSSSFAESVLQRSILAHAPPLFA
jgi:hypothetical protein